MHFIFIMFFLLIFSTVCYSESAIIKNDIQDHGEVHFSDTQINLTNQIEKIEQGKTLIFGHYEQNNILSDGPEPLSWILLNKNNDLRIAILITSYIIDCKKFNGFSEYATWDVSSLRMYMNNEMINEMFTDDEKSCIKLSEIENAPNSYCGSYCGETTYDKIFIPSIADMYKFFGNNDLSSDMKWQELLRPNINRAAKATKYAISKGVRVTSFNHRMPGYGNYFLRTSGKQGYRKWYGNTYANFFQSYVTEFGELKPEGTGINSCDDGIRVMMQVYY